MKVPKEFLELHQEPGVTDEEFAAFEEAYGVVLPEDMKAFYRRQNGGLFKRDREYVLKNELYLEVFHPIARTFGEHFLTIDHLLKWQQMDGFRPDRKTPPQGDLPCGFTYIVD